MVETVLLVVQSRCFSSQQGGGEKLNRPYSLFFLYPQVLDLVKREIYPEINQKRRSLMRKGKRRKTRDLHCFHINKRRNMREKRMRGSQREGVWRASRDGPRGARHCH